MKKTEIAIILLSGILMATAYGNDADNPNDIESVKKVVIAEGEARQNNDFELFSACWAHEPYILHFWAINLGCGIIKGWEDLSENFKKSIQSAPDPKDKIRRENIAVHVNGNMALAYFDLYIDKPDGNLEARANMSLEKINDTWKVVFLNVVFDKSYQK